MHNLRIILDFWSVRTEQRRLRLLLTFQSGNICLVISPNVLYISNQIRLIFWARIPRGCNVTIWSITVTDLICAVTQKSVTLFVNNIDKDFLFFSVGIFAHYAPQFQVTRNIQSRSSAGFRLERRSRHFSLSPRPWHSKDYRMRRSISREESSSSLPRVSRGGEKKRGRS